MQCFCNVLIAQLSDIKLEEQMKPLRFFKVCCFGRKRISMKSAFEDAHKAEDLQLWRSHTVVA